MRTILNVMCPESNKSLSRQGWPCCPFSSTGLGIHVNLPCLSHNAMDTAGQCPNHRKRKKKALPEGPQSLRLLHTTDAVGTELGKMRTVAYTQNSPHIYTEFHSEGDVP